MTVASGVDDGELVVIVGRSLDDFRTIADSKDLPPSAAVVVLTSANQKGVGLLRRMGYDGHTLLWLTPEETAQDPSAIAEAHRRGFDDVAVGEDDARARVAWALQRLRRQRTRDVRLEENKALMALLREMGSRPELEDILHTALTQMSELFDVDKVSVVLFEPGGTHAYVVMEGETQLDNLVISLEDYPELREVISTREPLFISDVLGDALMSGVRHKLHAARVAHRSAVLFPLTRKSRVVGALFLRSTRPMPSVEYRLLRMGRGIALVTALALGNALEQDMLLSMQRLLLRQQEDADQMVETFRPFAEFFEQASDGILVTNSEGMISYANPAACRVLRRSAEELKVMRFLDLLGSQYQRLAERAFEGESMGDVAGYVDLVVELDDGIEAVLSAAIRPMQDAEGTLVSFRDVTELREIEAELRQTKEFLENLIQSSVDGIIAADTKGTIILMNRAAEEMLGYQAREAVGSMSVGDLYPPGEAEDMMRRLRSSAHGGRGRLELLRKDLLTKSGDLVPVNLTAAIIFEGEQEVASVGIFTDLRDRMRMEEKLSQAQQQLKLSERRAVAIELAGVAAHELNQPLTSILGYAEMLKRRVSEDDANRKPVDVIARESERMARIVRRLGEITDYRSRAYVGDATILDLGDVNTGDATEENG